MQIFGIRHFSPMGAYHCFACNPEKIPVLLENVLKGKNISNFINNLESRG